MTINIYSNISSHTPLLLNCLIIHCDSAAHLKWISVKSVSVGTHTHKHLCSCFIVSHFNQFNHWCPDCLLTDCCYHFSFGTMANGWYILPLSTLRVHHSIFEVHGAVLAVLLILSVVYVNVSYQTRLWVHHYKWHLSHTSSHLIYYWYKSIECICFKIRNMCFEIVNVYYPLLRQQYFGSHQPV